MMEKIKVMIVDDQTIIRDGLKSLLEAKADIDVIGLIENGEKACKFASSLKPDVILMDIRMPLLNGVEATKCIKKENPEIKIIILTTFDDDAYIIEAMRYGASGYLLKDIRSEKLYEAIKDSISDNIILPGNIALKIISNLSYEEKKEKSISSIFLS